MLTKLSSWSKRDAYKKIDLDKSYPSLFELLWYSQLPCFDVLNVTSFELGYGKVNKIGQAWIMVARQHFNIEGMIKDCVWKGRRLNCSSIFSMYPTDRGMCCTFNKQKANDMFKKSRYQEHIDMLTDQDKYMSFEDSSFPSWKVS